MGIDERICTLRLAGLGALLLGGQQAGAAGRVTRPNILVVMADDQSYPYASAYGCRMVSTPGFDTVAALGALFENAYATSPGSSPSRASMLTGLYPWQIEQAGTHGSLFPAQYTCYPELLERAGYHVGYTGKGWGPGEWRAAGRTCNPAGREYNACQLEPPFAGLSRIDYTANFRAFLEARPAGAPFCFWLGTREPHRPYERDSWQRQGMSLEQAEVPGFLPDSTEVRGDLLDYAVEIEWMDRHLCNCLEELRRRGELENTIVIVTADNGMPFPRAKANCYDAGLHVPLAVCWGARIRGGQHVEALVSLVDLFPTLLEAAGVIAHSGRPPVGKSLLPLLAGDTNSVREAVYGGRERHSSARYANWGYPIRCIRERNWMLVRNFHCERWPAGDPCSCDASGRPGPACSAFYDMDDAPTKDFLIRGRTEPGVGWFFELATAHRPEYELYDLTADPACLHNLCGDPRHAAVEERLKRLLNDELERTHDPRVGPDPEIWERYPRLSGGIRHFPPPEDPRDSVFLHR